VIKKHINRNFRGVVRNVNQSLGMAATQKVLEELETANRNQLWWMLKIIKISRMAVLVLHFIPRKRVTECHNLKPKMAFLCGCKKGKLQCFCETISNL
jgi:hypothetical protein